MDIRLPYPSDNECRRVLQFTFRRLAQAVAGPPRFLHDGFRVFRRGLLRFGEHDLDLGVRLGLCRAQTLSALTFCVGDQLLCLFHRLRLTRAGLLLGFRHLLDCFQRHSITAFPCA